MKCLIKNCNNDAKVRGLCVRCYQTARRLVKQGKTTWGDLAARGLVLNGMPTKAEASAFTAAFRNQVYDSFQESKQTPCEPQITHYEGKKYKDGTTNGK